MKCPNNQYNDDASMNTHISGGGTCRNCPPKFSRSGSQFLCELDETNTAQCSGAICPYGAHSEVLSTCPDGFSAQNGVCTSGKILISQMQKFKKILKKFLKNLKTQKIESNNICIRFLDYSAFNTIWCSPQTGEICVEGLGRVQCQDGFFASNFVNCVKCPVGSECKAGIRSVCTGNTFCNKEYCTECIPCPAGAACTNTGIVEFCDENEYLSGGQCRTCPANQRIDGTSCRACGQTGSDYHDEFSPPTQCESCPDGHECSTAGKTQCDVNKHAEAGSGCEFWNDYLLSTAGVDCPSGTYPIKDSAKCEPCPMGYSCSVQASKSLVCIV